MPFVALSHTVMRYLLLAAAFLAVSPLAVAQNASSDSQEVDCETTCDLFGSAPPPCECTLRGGASPQNMEPQAVRARMRETFAQSVESVDNYTMVVTTSRTPIPVVQYFEKEMIEGEPVFRQVSPAVLAEREAEAGGGPTPKQMGGGMAAIFGAVRERVSGSNPPSPSAGVDHLPEGTDSLLDVLGAISDGLEGMIEALLNPIELTSNEDLVEQILQIDEFWQRAVYVGPQTIVMEIPTSQDPTLIPDATIERVAYLYYADGLEDVDLGDGSELYELVDASIYMSGANRLLVPLAVIVKIRDRATGEIMTLKKQHSRYRRAGPMTKPFTILNTMSDTSGLIGDVAIWVDTILVNDGAPTQEQIAVLSQTALDRHRGD